MSDGKRELAGPGQWRLAGIDSGIVTVPVSGYTASFTGVSLAGRAVCAIEVATGRRIMISSITDPAGGVVGTIYFKETVASGTVLVVPYYAVPHSWRSTGDETAVVRDDPEWAHFSGPLQFENIGPIGVGNGTTFRVFPTLNYSTFHMYIAWSNTGTSTQDIRVYGNFDGTAWGTIGTVPDPRDICSWMQTTTGSSAFKTMLTSGKIMARFQEAYLFREIVVEITTGNTGGNTTLTAYYGLSNQGH